MKKMISIAAVAGLAAAASAQGVTLHFDVDGDPLSGAEIAAGNGDVVSWSVFASFTGYDDDSAYFGGFSGPEPGFGNFIASDPNAATVSNITVEMPNQALDPSANGASIEEINIFASALLGTNNPANPILIMTFDTTFSGPELSYSADGVASVFPDDGIFTLPDEFTDVSIISDTLVPAPGAFALLGLGGLAAARRRR
jgi:hypothetical protein